MLCQYFSHIAILITLAHLLMLVFNTPTFDTLYSISFVFGDNGSSCGSLESSVLERTLKLTNLDESIKITHIPISLTYSVQNVKMTFRPNSCKN